LNNLILEHQHHDQWCWAAVTEAVCRFFGSNASTQEAIVCQVLANPLCDSAPVPDACDIPFPVEFALDAMGHPNDEVGVLSFDDVKQQIDALAHPVPIRILFNGALGGTSHYCLIQGWDEIGGVPHVTVLDPASGAGEKSVVSYDGLCSGVSLGGAWVDSFTLR
jgi:hypothetical protein